MKILFVCYGNSCRSPMAESIFNTLNTNREHKAHSAGLSPADRIQPETKSVLEEDGYITEGLRPKRVTEDLLEVSDRIIAMDNWIADQLEGRATDVWLVEDPYKSPIDYYRRTRNTLVEMIRGRLLNDLR